MSTMRKTLAVSTTSLLVISGVTGGIIAATSASDADAALPQTTNVNEESEYYKTDIVTMDVVAGEFSYTQTKISSNEDVAAVTNNSQYLCASQVESHNNDETVAEDWSIAVVGKVVDPIEMTFAEMKASPDVQKSVMGCSCAGNPADGRATANAEVTGISVAAILDAVGVEEGANTIVFTSADGYQVALPLSYVLQRNCILVFDVNGAPISEVVGGRNQLWLGSTAASYFARDVEIITLEQRQTPPPSPSSDEAREAYENLPNIGVLFGGEVR
ncbi:Oxidoreductase molybdopterin binding domain [Slackia heliotrinireducens]|uniref:Sulfite oxidase-like oxidoreductase n=1 Tax=Slackia heliotrinireducens (strain ATCC 29202 / DSM 20476 / NCTC 11029 / RHS 1) TaxID=471855 RepID=C7N271_SLAHD|nr:molybdopterin-dependent oxidoreductase [Slackia heliotrinireducens]ACV21377.1 sulfite oxidase-like oxidoreductase [Slackia heliotrinireducens DSM 20476]VEG98809.1 Oxidoreductase molybdopterin binding domain [Slackia heliotrinireducens]